jgi:hypothetical protein
MEMGANYFESRKKDFIIKQSIKKLEAFGFQVNLQTAEEIA